MGGGIRKGKEERSRCWNTNDRTMMGHGWKPWERARKNGLTGKGVREYAAVVMSGAGDVCMSVEDVEGSDELRVTERLKPLRQNPKRVTWAEAPTLRCALSSSIPPLAGDRRL
jgi:hypothetical protein